LNDGQIPNPSNPFGIVPLSNFVLRGFGFVHHSIAILYHEVPNPNLTIRFCIAVCGLCIPPVREPLKTCGRCGRATWRRCTCGARRSPTRRCVGSIFRVRKGMNGLKILSSTRTLVQTNLPTTHQPSCRRRLTQLGSSPNPHPQSKPTLRTAGTLQGVPPSCCGRRAAVWSAACSNRHQGSENSRRQLTRNAEVASHAPQVRVVARGFDQSVPPGFALAHYRCVAQ
jgi:hypothetical protein